MLILVALYFFAVLALAWRNFRLAIGFLIIALPSYLIRFNVGPLPSTALELTFGAVFLVWLIKYSRVDWPVIKEVILKHKFLFICLGLFFMASLVGCFVSDMVLKSLGQWRAYFLEPIILFFVLLGRRSQLKTSDLVWFLGLSTLSISLLALIQKLTGSLYDPSLWADNLNGRVTSFFTTPNAIGLYLESVVILLAAFLFLNKAVIKTGQPVQKLKYFSLATFLILALLAIFFSFSQGAWVALAVGAVLFVYLVGYKKTALGVLLLGIILVLAIPAMRPAVLFQDKAGQNRLVLWGDSWKFLSASPKNFVLGAGVRQFFRKVEKSTYNPQEMERLIYPHNLFLNFWVETGLVGMLSFAGILGYAFYLGYKIRKNNLIWGAGLMAALVVFLIHGLVDVTYFKNDLAMLFWIIISIVIPTTKEESLAVSRVKPEVPLPSTRDSE